MRVTAPILALARDEITAPSIEGHVTNATSPAIVASESVVREATHFVVEVVA